MIYVFCPKCGTESAAGARFCTHCGTPMAPLEDIAPAAAPAAESFVFHMLGNLLWLVSIVLWVFLMVKAYQGERYKLPVVGDLAERYAGQ
ncbi:MAG: zinc-ribbon domain-containing protein [Armatimonadetes bacterium]|nr:zinc-ribbon domain-containing protein [Armatimonadota bacterium]